MDVIIRQGKHEEIAGFKSAAARERVTLANPPGAVWFVATDEAHVIVGFVCLVVNAKKTLARFKSDYVIPGRRCRGIYRALFNARMVYALAMGLKCFTAFTTKLSRPLYLEYGFKPAEQSAKSAGRDIFFMRKEFK